MKNMTEKDLLQNIVKMLNLIYSNLIFKLINLWLKINLNLSRTSLSKLIKNLFNLTMKGQLKD